MLLVIQKEEHLRMFFIGPKVNKGGNVGRELHSNSGPPRLKTFVQVKSLLC
mgnify:CR=1 FL=1